MFNNRMKRSASILLTATEDDVLGLTVAAAEGVVLAGVMESCFSTSELLPGMTVETTLQLRRARRRIGLDDLCFEAHDCVNADEDWMDFLEDSAMHDDFVDVGLSVTVGHPGLKNSPLVEDDFGARSNARPLSAESTPLPGRPGLNSPEGSHPHCGAYANRDAMLTPHIDNDGCVSSGHGNTSVASGKPTLLAEARRAQEQEKRNCALLQACKRVPNIRLLEYSNLTESEENVGGGAASEQDVPQDRVRCFGTLPVTSLAHKEGGTTGNARPEILDCSAQMKLHVIATQNSVSSSGSCLKEPVCSSVPCSRAGSINVPSRPCEPTNLTCMGDTVDGWPGNHNSPGDVDCTLHTTDLCVSKNKILPEVKRSNFSALQRFSTTLEPLGLLLHAANIASRKSLSSTLLEDDSAQPAMEGNMGCPQEVENSILSIHRDSTESPPLLWPRTKKCRLWASRVVESESTHCLVENSAHLGVDSPIQSDHSSLGNSCSVVWPCSTKSRLRAWGEIDCQSTDTLTERPGMEKSIPSNLSNKRESPTFLRQCNKKPRLRTTSRLVRPLSPSMLAEDPGCPGLTGGEAYQANKDTEEHMVVLKSRISGEPCRVDCLQQHLTVAVAEAAVNATFPEFALPKTPPTSERATLQPQEFRKTKWQRTPNQCPNTKLQVGVLDQPQKLFKGLQFLLTGFQGTREVDMITKIKQHGGSVLSEIPPPSVLEAKLLRETAGARMRLPIVIASSQVRTSKFLYACAIGFPPVKAAWIFSSINMNRCLPTRKYEHICSLQNLKGLKEADPSPIFQGVRALVYGQSTFRARLAILVEHGGGRVLRSIRSMKQVSAVVGRKLDVVIAENCEGYRARHRRTLLRFNLSIVPAEWLVQSLLLQRLLPIPFEDVSIQPKPAALLSPKLDPLYNILVVRKKRSKSVADRCTSNRVSHVILEQQPLRQRCKGLCISSSPIPVPQLMHGVNFFSESCANQASSENNLFYGAVRVDGIDYHVGETVEVSSSPMLGTASQVVRIESLWSEVVNRWSPVTSCDSTVDTSKPAINMSCRLFLSACGASEELHATNQLVENLPACSIVRKVSITLQIEGQTYKCNNSNQSDQLNGPASGNSTPPNFFCSSFYDHKTDSLHKFTLSV